MQQVCVAERMRRKKQYASKTKNDLTGFWIGNSNDIIIFDLEILEVIERFLCMSYLR